MAGFHVNIQRLRRRSDSFGEAADIIRGIRLVTGPIEDCDAGPGDISQACADFADALVRSLEELPVDDIAGKLAVTAKAYEQVEQATGLVIKGRR